MFTLDWKTTSILCLFLSAGFYWLVELARRGETVAWIILVALLILILLSILLGGVLLIIKAISASEQRAFINNARENLAIMRQMQALQNAQTTHLARRNAQLEQQVTRQLPPPEDAPPAIIFDAEIFEDLDEEIGD